MLYRFKSNVQKIFWNIFEANLYYTLTLQKQLKRLFHVNYTCKSNGCCHNAVHNSTRKLTSARLQERWHPEQGVEENQIYCFYEPKNSRLSIFFIKLNMASASSTTKSEFLVNGKYRLVRKVGSGSFGDIYLGINIQSGEVSLYHFY